MSTIDADAHVIECEATFEHMDPQLRKYRPRVMVQKSYDDAVLDNEGKNIQKEFWAIDGRLHPKEGNIGYNTSKESREMSDVTARLKHMDELEIDIQVLYPTIFLRAWTSNPTVEYALCKSYNRWLADIWKKAPDRLKWAVMPPLLSMDKVADELKFAKDHGAVAVFLRGIECEMQLDDPYFHRLYELGEELDLAMGFHAGNGSLTHHAIYGGGGLARGKLPVVSAFTQIIASKIPEQFPKIRWGFIEVSAQWLPYVANDMALRYKLRQKEMPKNLLAENNCYIACLVTDDFDWILPLAGDDHLVVGTDYGHHDTSTEIEALRKLRDDGRLPAGVANRILGDNAKALYGF